MNGRAMVALDWQRPFREHSTEVAAVPGLGRYLIVRALKVDVWVLSLGMDRDIKTLATSDDVSVLKRYAESDLERRMLSS